MLSNLAALYWRIYGEGELAVDCLKHALYFSDSSNKVSWSIVQNLIGCSVFDAVVEVESTPES